MTMALLELIEVFHFLGEAFNGWRFLLSSDFRERVFARWQKLGRGWMLAEIFGYGIATVATGSVGIWALFWFSQLVV